MSYLEYRFVLAQRKCHCVLFFILFSISIRQIKENALVVYFSESYINIFILLLCRDSQKTEMAILLCILFHNYVCLIFYIFYVYMLLRQNSTRTFPDFLLSVFWLPNLAGKQKKTTDCHCMVHIINFFDMVTI